MISLHARIRLCIVILAVVSMDGRARADGDFDASSTSWNGLSQLLEISTRSGRRAEAITTVDLDTLTPSDSLLLIHPTSELPNDSLARFLREGGRLLIADESGVSDEFLGHYGIHRKTADADHATHLRGDADLPVARAARGHTLTDGLDGIVTNHPAELSHGSLPALLAFEKSSSAVMLAGAVGQGRLIAISDSSVFINNMLSFRDNRLLAERVVDYLVRDRNGRLLIASGDVEWQGRFTFGGPNTARERMGAWLRGLTRLDLPPEALRALSATIVAVLIILGTTVLPRRTPYRSERMFPIPWVEAGFESRVQSAIEGSRGRIDALLQYQAVFEAALVGAPGERSAAAAKQFLGRLEAIHRHGTADHSISDVEFHSIIAEGESILRALRRKPA